MPTRPRNIDDDAVEAHIFVPRELWHYLKKAAKRRKQHVNDLVVLCCIEHVHCLDEQGRLLPYDFD